MPYLHNILARIKAQREYKRSTRKLLKLGLIEPAVDEHGNKGYKLAAKYTDNTGEMNDIGNDSDRSNAACTPSTGYD
jgi:hypothetical protein